MRRTAALVAVLLAGCLAPGSVPPREYYVLADLGMPAASVRGPRIDSVLLVSTTSVGEFYDTQSLVFSRVPGQRAYYQFAAWTERPGRKLTELLISRLSADNAFRSVASTTAGARGDFMLNTRLEEIYVDASARPASVRITLVAELVDLGHGTIVARHRFEKSAPTAGDSASETVVAFDDAVTALLGEVSAWVSGAATG